MRKLWTLVFIPAAILALGCLPPLGPISPGRPCTMQYVYGLSVNVTDARTGQPVNAVVTITEGSYRETLENFDPTFTGSYVGAGERPGTYVVTVTAPGYRTPAPQTITLGFDGCHVIPQSLNIALEPV